MDIRSITTDPFVKLRVKKSIENMKKKKLLPDHTLVFYGPDNLENHAKQTQLQVFREWSCDKCLITVYGSKKMLVDHQKTHSIKREIKENEIFKMDHKLY